MVKSKVMPGFTLQGTLGPPTQAAETLLSTVRSSIHPLIHSKYNPPTHPPTYLPYPTQKAIAPPGSGKNATLLAASAEDRGVGGTVYQFEYIVRKEGGRVPFALHSLSVIAARPAEDTLFTLTVLAPESRWKEREVELRQVAESFRLTRQ